MPTYVGKYENGFWENKFIGYTNKELTTEKILKETETYKNTIKEWADMGEEEGVSAKEFYNSMGMCETWEEFVKSSLIDGMIKEKKLKMYHDRNNDRMLYHLI
jgi:hypothetical protein